MRSPLRRRAHTAWLGILALLLFARCGGGGGGGNSTTAPSTTPVDNSVRRVDVAPGGPLALVSGTTAQATATAFTAAGTPLSGSVTVTWLSSNDNIASVNGGLISAKLVGTVSITAVIGGVSSAGVSVTVSPGAAAKLGVRTQPAGATSRSPLATQPVVEVQDAAGNLVSQATTVTAALGSGGGTLAGTTTTSTVGGVATFGDLSISGTVGARTLTFTATGVAPANSASFNLQPGAAVALFIATQPVANTAYATFPTPAVVEIRDADNNTTTSTAQVGAAIASGGGTLGGTATVAAVNGKATFSSLTIVGSAGARTLSFSAIGLPTVTSSSFNVLAAPPAVITFTPASASLSGATGTTTSVGTVQVLNTGVFPLTNLRVTGITYGTLQPTGWLTATLGSATPPTSLSLQATVPASIGTFTATVQVAGDGAAVSPVSLTVTLTALPVVVNVFGTAANRVSILNIGDNFTPGVVSTQSGAPSTDATLVFVSRSPGVATVNASSGTITGAAEGGAWVVATSQRAASDSVYVIVPRNKTGPVIRLDLTKYNFSNGDTITAKVMVDMRGSGSLGALNMTTGWTVYAADQTTNMLSYVQMVSPATPLTMVNSYDSNQFLVRSNTASATGVGGLIEVGTLKLRTRFPGNAWIYLNALELLGADLTNLLSLTTVTQYPLVVR